MNDFDNHLCGVFQRVTEALQRATGLTCFQCAYVTLSMAFASLIGLLFWDIFSVETNGPERLMWSVVIGLVVVSVKMAWKHISDLSREVENASCFKAGNRTRSQPLSVLVRFFSFVNLVIVLLGAVARRDIGFAVLVLHFACVSASLYLCACTPLRSEE